MKRNRNVETEFASGLIIKRFFPSFDLIIIEGSACESNLESVIFLWKKVRSASPKLIHGGQSYISEVKISRNSGDGGREEPCSLCSLNVPH